LLNEDEIPKIIVIVALGGETYIKSTGVLAGNLKKSP